MRTLTEAQARKLHDSGMKLRTEDGRRYIPKGPAKEAPLAPVEVKVPEVVKVVPAVEPPKAEPKDDKIIQSMATILQENTKNTGILTTIVKQLAEPKPKKKFNCLVARDVRGQITAINIEER